MERKSYFELLSAKRYFHLVAFKAETNYSLNDFWKDCGFKKRLNTTTYDVSNFIIEQNRILSDLRFFNGEEDYSVNGDGLPPFNYDVFAVEMKKLKIFIFAFPFKYFAKTTIEKLISQKKILSRGHFLKPDLNKLVKINSETDFIDDDFTTYFSGLELMLTGDTNITSVNLDGDKPLESALYKTVFSRLLDGNQCILEKCSLKCITSSNGSDIPKTKSSVHLDLSGNYKVWVHGSGNNIFTIPLMFNVLQKNKCLEPTLTNPISRLKDE